MSRIFSGNGNAKVHTLAITSCRKNETKKMGILGEFFEAHARSLLIRSFLPMYFENVNLYVAGSVLTPLSTKRQPAACATATSATKNHRSTSSNATHILVT